MERNKPHQSSSKYEIYLSQAIPQLSHLPITHEASHPFEITPISVYSWYYSSFLNYYHPLHRAQFLPSNVSLYLVNKTVWLHKYNGLSSGIMQKITQAQDGTGNSSLLVWIWVWFCQCTALPLKIMLVPWPESSTWRSSNRRGWVSYFLSNKPILTRAEW